MKAFCFYFFCPWFYIFLQFVDQNLFSYFFMLSMDEGSTTNNLFENPPWSGYKFIEQQIGCKWINDDVNWDIEWNVWKDTFFVKRIFCFQIFYITFTLSCCWCLWHFSGRLLNIAVYFSLFDKFMINVISNVNC